MTQSPASKGNEHFRGWPRRPLRRFAELQLGKMLDKAKNKGTPTKYLRNINIRWFSVDLTDLLEMPFTEPEQEKFALRNGDIMICEGGEPGRAAIWTGGNTAIKYQKAIHRVRLHPGQNAKWVTYQLYYLAQEGRLAEHFSGTTIKHLPQEALAEVEFLTPPEAEQGRIVAKLDSLLARSRSAYEELTRIQRLVERYKHAVLSAAFRGEITADWRMAHTCSAKQLLTKLNVEPLPSSGLPPLPRTWAWVRASDLCQIKGGITLGKKRANGTPLIELPYLRVANVQRGWLDLSEIKKLQVTPSEAIALQLKPGDVLMNEGGDRDKLGRGWVWEGQIENCIHQNHVFRLRPKLADLSSRYISYYSNEFGQLYFFQEGKQTTNLASISLTKVSALPIPLAPSEEMALVVARIERAFSAINRITAETKRADELIKRLEQATLRKVFSGELFA